MTLRIFSSLASVGPCIGPPPPNATIAKSRGSYPRRTEISFNALFILESATRIMLSADSSAEILKCFPTFSTKAFFTLSRETSMSKFFAERRPAIRLASVVVGSVPFFP